MEQVILRLEHANEIDASLAKEVLVACGVSDADTVWWRFLKLIECGASLDAAIALTGRLLPGWESAEINPFSRPAYACLINSKAIMAGEDGPPSFSAHAPTPAIALLIATLKAHDNLKEQSA